MSNIPGSNYCSSLTERQVKEALNTTLTTSSSGPKTGTALASETATGIKTCDGGKVKNPGLPSTAIDHAVNFVNSQLEALETATKVIGYQESQNLLFRHYGIILKELKSIQSEENNRLAQKYPLKDTLIADGVEYDLIIVTTPTFCYDWHTPFSPYRPFSRITLPSIQLGNRRYGYIPKTSK